MFTAQELAWIAGTAAVAAAVGGAFGWYTSRRRLARTASVLLAPVFSGLLLGVLYSLWVLAVTSVHGTPNGTHPLTYSLASGAFVGIGLAFWGALPAAAGSAMAVGLTRGWSEPGAGRPPPSGES